MTDQEPEKIETDPDATPNEEKEAQPDPNAQADGLS